MKYEGFPESFLKLIIRYQDEGQDKRVDVSNFDCYKVLELDWKKLIKKKVINEEDLQQTDEGKEIIKAYRKLSLKHHPDKAGGSQEKFQEISRAKEIIFNNDVKVANSLKSQYDQNYQSFFIDKNAGDDFRKQVKNRLQELSKKTEETGGDVKDNDNQNGESGGAEDISAYVHLFPKKDFIDREIGKMISKRGISRCANWIIYVYSLLRDLQNELDGNPSALYNNKGKKISPSQLGKLSNFKTDIWKHQHRDDVTAYASRVKKTFQKIVTGKDSKSFYPYQDAQNENLDILRAFPGWDELSGPEELQYSEKFHFVSGYSHGERGITLIKLDDPNHSAYKNVINRAKLFIKIKGIIKSELTKFDNLFDAEGDRINTMWFLDLRRKLKGLEELEEVKNGGKYISYTKTKFASDSQLVNLNREITKLFKELRDEIKKVGSKPRPKKGGNDNRKDQGDPGKDAVQEIEQALKEVGYKDSEVGMSNLWRNDFLYKWKGNIKEIDKWKILYLNNIYRVSARRKLTQKLAVASISEKTILGSGKTLKEHFKSFQGKSAIDAEFLRLAKLIDNQGQDNDQEIKSAIGAVKNTLQTNDLGQDQTKIEIILGKNWESQFQGLDKKSIEKLRDNFIKKITDFVAKDKDAARAIIQEITKALQAAGLPESILGENWKTGLAGKNETAMNAERDRLLKIIEAEINKKNDSGEMNEEEAKEKKKDLVENRKKNITVEIAKKTKEGHQKLAVEISELPTQLFAPHKSLEEKLNSLDKLEEISAFNEKLLTAINDKKNEKLEVIVNDAIGEIEQEIGTLNIELGKNKDFKEKIKNSRDPDIIEMIKQNILQLIKEQKMAAALNETSFSQGDQPEEPGTSWPKIIGISTLIISPLVIVFIILRVRRRRKDLN